MSKVFLYGTKLQEMEQLMLLVPNFAPRMKGMVVVGKRMVNGNEEFKKCIYCDNYTKGGCKGNQCTHLMERAAFGQIKYGAFLKDSFGDFHHYYLNKRIKQLIHSFRGDWFMNHTHKGRFERVCRMQGIPVQQRNPFYLATLYLLMANDILWNRIKDHVYLNSFDFPKAHLYGIDTDGYALFQMAKTIATGKKSIEINEIADEQLIGNSAFKAIVNATLIAKYGGEILTVRQ